MKKKNYIFFFLCLLALSGFAQEINVTGVVTEASTKEPMPGVTVCAGRGLDGDGGP